MAVGMDQQSAQPLLNNRLEALGRQSFAHGVGTGLG